MTVMKCVRPPPNFRNEKEMFALASGALFVELSTRPLCPNLNFCSSENTRERTYKDIVFICALGKQRDESPLSFN
jgi:hypothetical protein